MYSFESLNFNPFLVSKDKEKGGLWVAGNFSKPERQRDRETERQTDRQTDRETNRETDRQIKNQSVKGVHHKGPLQKL